MILFAPWLIVAGAIAGILAGASPPRRSDPEQRGRWRRAGFRELWIGTGTLAACAALWVPLDLGGELRRFSSRWGGGLLHGGVHPDAIMAHPWGWLPPALVLGLLGAGALTLWRAR